MEAEVCEYVITNSELDWLSAADTADLTAAPILGITASEEEKSRKQTGPYGSILVGGDSDGIYPSMNVGDTRLIKSAVSSTIFSKKGKPFLSTLGDPVIGGSDE